jgi:hypothetical protein
MLQLMVESPHHFTFHTLQAGQSYAPFNPVAVEKSERVMEVLQARFSLSRNPDKQSPLLTPTAINRYMRCPLQFYYYYVCDLKELDDVEDDSIDNRIFGNIFHEAAQLIYKRIMDRNGRIERQSLDDLLKNKGFSPGAFLDWAKRKDILKHKYYGPGNKNNKLTIQVRVGNKNVPHVVLKLPEEEMTEQEKYKEYVVVDDPDLPF